MNQDVFEGKWKEMRGQVKEWWDKLTDDCKEILRMSAQIPRKK